MTAWVKDESALTADGVEVLKCIDPSANPPLVAGDPPAYVRQRASEYPPITDYIDGVVKGDQAQIDSYIQACLAVKAKYPKPLA